MSNNPYTPSIDLVPHMQSNPNYYPPNQTHYNACQRFACDLAVEGKHYRAGQPIQTNRSAGYFMTKEQGWSGGMGNNGANVDDVSSAYQRVGIPTDLSWNDMGDYNARPPQSIYDNAALYKGARVDYMPYISSGPARDDPIQSIHVQLQRGELLVAKLRMTASFDNDAGQAGNWLHSDWDGAYRVGNEGRGDHVVTICGIDLAAGRLLAANHWGENWGDGGFFGVPFDKVRQGPQRCFDIFYVVNNLRVQPVGVPMSHSAPSLLTPEQQNAGITALKIELENAYRAGHAAAPAGTDAGVAGWIAALARGGELRISDKQFEASAPGLQPLPRYTVRSFVDRGDMPWPAGMREEVGV